MLVNVTFVNYAGERTRLPGRVGDSLFECVFLAGGVLYACERGARAGTGARRRAPAGRLGRLPLVAVVSRPAPPPHPPPTPTPPLPPPPLHPSTPPLTSACPATRTPSSVAKRYQYSHVDGACGGGGSPRDLLHKDGGWYEPKYGEGAQCHFCHVIIPKSHYAALPPKRPDELSQLRKYPFPEDMTDTSRLACQVRLTKEMDGMVVYCPDGPPALDT